MAEQARHAWGFGSSRHAEPSAVVSLDTLPFPRIHLAQYPSPFHRLSRLSQWLGREVWIKRDDVIGPAMGGNKVRKLEFILADALKKGARRVVTFGGLQSNHVRMTAAAARRLGLETHLFFFEHRPQRLQGNLLLNELLGAHMHFVPLGSGGGMSLETTNRLVRLIALARIGPHYFIPVGGHTWQGALGYVLAAVELVEQAREAGIDRGRVVVAVGSGGTLAGLMAGFHLTRTNLRLVGIDVGKLWKGFPASIAHLASKVCEKLGAPHTFRPKDVPLIEERYVGEKYASPTAEGIAAIRTLAETEGILLDPVYTGKAFAGMLDMARRGHLGRDEPLIFIHTGGTPGLFAYANVLGARKAGGA